MKKIDEEIRQTTFSLYDIGQEKGFGVKQSIWIGDTVFNIFDVKL